MLKLAVCRLRTLAAVEQFGGGLGEQREALVFRVTNHRAKKRRQNLLTRLRYTCNSRRYPRVACQDLMAAFVGDHHFEGKILRVGIPLERFGIDGEQIIFGRVAPAALRAAGLAVDVAKLDATDKPELSRGTGRAVAPAAPFRRSLGTRRWACHATIVPILLGERLPQSWAAPG